MKRDIIAGNWKMNKTQEETKALIKEIAPLVKDANCEVVLCVPYTNLEVARKAMRGTKVQLGAQNVHWAPKGAFTGEVSAEMLKELKVKYVIIGHSERRQYFGETDMSVNARTKAALEAGLKAIVCVGETLEQREAGETNRVLAEQIEKGLAGLTKKDLKNIVIAYEPVWAIGTGKTATAEDANETIGVMRKGIIRQMFGKYAANSLRIQYGGSMNAKNAKELMAMPEIDGGLIGGASLKAEDFAVIVNYDK